MPVMNRPRNKQEQVVARAKGSILGWLKLSRGKPTKIVKDSGGAGARGADAGAADSSAAALPWPDQWQAQGHSTLLF